MALLDGVRGTNMLTVTSGQSYNGQETELPATATEMIRRAGGVLRAAPTAQLSSAGVYLNQFVPSGQTGGLAVRACNATLLPRGKTRVGGNSLHADGTQCGRDAAVEVSGHTNDGQSGMSEKKVEVAVVCVGSETRKNAVNSATMV